MDAYWIPIYVGSHTGHTRNAIDQSLWPAMKTRWTHCKTKRVCCRLIIKIEGYHHWFTFILLHTLTAPRPGNSIWWGYNSAYLWSIHWKTRSTERDKAVGSEETNAYFIIECILSDLAIRMRHTAGRCRVPSGVGVFEKWYNSAYHWSIHWKAGRSTERDKAVGSNESNS